MAWLLLVTSSHRLETLDHASWCPQRALVGQGDRSAPRTRAGERLGGILCTGGFGKGEVGMCTQQLCVGIWAAGMRIRGMHELTAPGDGRWCSSADLHNHH